MPNKEAVRLLLVEDEVLLAADIRMRLEAMGYWVLGHVTSGEDAIDFAQAQEPDLILMDVELWGPMDGIEAARRIRRVQQIPVIYLTNMDGEEYLMRATKTRPSAYLLKPFEDKEVHIAIRMALANELPLAIDEGEPAEHFLKEDAVFLRQGERYCKVLANDVLYLEAERAYCQVHTKVNSYLLSVSMSGFLKQVSLPGLLQVHRSFVVNRIHITQVNTDFSGLQIGR